MKLATLCISFLLMATAAAREQWPVFISFREAELRHARQTALHAINSDDEWRRFPKSQHKPHYTPILTELEYAYSTMPTEGETLIVIIPTTHVGPRHRSLVYVTFNHRGKIVDLAEVPQI